MGINISHALRLCALLASVVGGAGCANSVSGTSPLYLYDAGTDKTMAAAKISFDEGKSKVAEIFKNQQQYISLYREERSLALRNRDATQRDSFLVSFLQGNNRCNGVDEMAVATDSRAAKLLGYPPQPISDSCKATKYSIDVPEDLWWQIRNIQIYHLEDSLDHPSLDKYPYIQSYRAVLKYEHAAQAYLRKENTHRAPVRCSAPLVSEDTSAEYMALRKACASPNFPQQGDLWLARIRLVEERASLQERQAAAQALATDIKAKKKSFEDAKDTASPTSEFEALKRTLASAASKFKDNPFVRKIVSSDLQDDIALVEQGLDPKGAVDATTAGQIRGSLAVVQALAGVGDAFANPPRVPHPNALRVLQAALDRHTALADAEIAYQRNKVAVAKRRADALATEAEAMVLAAAASRAVRATAFGNAPGPRNSGLAAIIARAGDPGNRGARALSAYHRAWDQGKVNYNLANDVDDAVAIRQYLLDTNRVAAESNFAIVAPGYDTLVAYGASGIKPESIMTLIGMIPIGIGVNR